MLFTKKFLENKYFDLFSKIDFGKIWKKNSP